MLGNCIGYLCTSGCEEAGVSSSKTSARPGNDNYLPIVADCCHVVRKATFWNDTMEDV